jgi:hypothetical protein
VPKSGDNTISIGGSVSGSAVLLGDKNQVAVTTQAQAPVDTKAMLAALEEVHKVLSQVAGPDAKRIGNAADEALEEAKTAEPRKSVVAESLERALKLATSVAGVGKDLETLKPSLSALAGWLGGEYQALLRLLGF